MIQKFRKKPVVIEAVQLTEFNASVVEHFVGDYLRRHYFGDIVDRSSPYDGLIIQTLEGAMLAKNGDYIIKGVNGEFYPCKPDIFEKTYEKVEL
jgi:hypothetical protein